jgi:hypothetical protein
MSKVGLGSHITPHLDIPGATLVSRSPPKRPWSTPQVILPTPLDSTGKSVPTIVEAHFSVSDGYIHS